MEKIFKTNDGCEFNTYDEAKTHEDSEEYKEYMENYNKHLKIINMSQKDLENEWIKELM